MTAPMLRSAETFHRHFNLSESSRFITTHILSILKLHSFQVASCIHLPTTYNRNRSHLTSEGFLSEHTQELIVDPPVINISRERQSFPVHHSSLEIEGCTTSRTIHKSEADRSLRNEHATDSTLRDGSDQVHSRCDASRHNQDRWCIRTHRESTLRVTP